MKVSIITVTYNSAKFISTCIQSVFSQTYTNIEYIIIDGGSNDGTLDIIKKYPQIKYISEPDKGIYDAVNKGIKLATGNIIGILNSDDFFSDDDVISRIVQNFNNDILLDAVYADVIFVSDEDVKKVIRYYSSRGFKPWMFRYGFQPAHPTFYAKKELFEKYGIYTTNFRIAGDFELLLRFILKNQIKYKYIKDVWVKMRVGGVSTSGIKSVLELNKEIIQACKTNKIYTNELMVYTKYLIKWWGFLIKKK